MKVYVDYGKLTIEKRFGKDDYVFNKYVLFVWNKLGFCNKINVF